MRFWLLTGLCFAAGASSGAAQTFEGTIVTQLYDKGMPRGELTASYRGAMARIDMKSRGGAGQGYMLTDGTAGVWTTVIPNQKMYVKMDTRAMAEGAARDAAKPKATGDRMPKITPTGASETIAGIRCEHFLVESAGSRTMDMCVAKGIGFFGMFGGGAAMGGRPAPGAMNVPLEYRDLVAKYKDGFQPLKVEEVNGGKREIVMQVISVEKKQLAAKDFLVPDGYREMKMPTMMKGKLPARIPGRPPIR